jgi:heme A synthase
VEDANRVLALVAVVAVALVAAWMYWTRRRRARG